MSRLSIGKRNEFKLWAHLLGEDIDVFPCIVDDKGIDGIVGYNSRYREVQIKSAASWYGHRGIDAEILKKHPERLIVIYNYSLRLEEDAIRFFTARQILNENAWQKSTGYGTLGQIPLNKEMLKKYHENNLRGLIRCIKGDGEKENSGDNTY